jgi:uncharacterized protein
MRGRLALIMALVCGMLFGFGLIVSGMSNPAKVLGFLDLAGAWDPSLALVMLGAVVVAAPGFAIAKSRAAMQIESSASAAATRRIDGRLVAGSLIFGIGWGLAGFCPGPALVAVGAGALKALVFVGAMLLGMAIFEMLER